MDIVIIGITALLAAGLTLFSGFGLGTMLMPVFALFFPLPVAIALTAVVHLLNNLFKLILLGRHAVLKIILLFGIPALLFAYLGAELLQELEAWDALGNYMVGDKMFTVEPVKLIIGILMIAFAFIDLLPKEKIQFPKGMLPVGGVLSGFIGGLSGHQGALRSAFLLRYGLSKEAFIATGVVIAVGVDVSRLLVYKDYFSIAAIQQGAAAVIVAVIAAFIGSYVGSRLLKKVTLKTVQIIVFILLVVIALMLIMGII